MFSFLEVREWLTQKKKYDMLLLPIFLVGIALLLVDCYKATSEIVPRDLACWDSRGCEIRWALASADSGDAVCPRRRLGRVSRPHVLRDIVWNKGRESTVPYTTDMTDSSDSSDLDFFFPPSSLLSWRMSFKGPVQTSESFIARGCEDIELTEKRSQTWAILFY